MTTQSHANEQKKTGQSPVLTLWPTVIEKLMLSYLTDADRYIIEIQHNRRSDRIDNDAVAFALAADNIPQSLPILGRYSLNCVIYGAALGGHIDLLWRWFVREADTILTIGIYTGNIAVTKFALLRGAKFNVAHIELALASPTRDLQNFLLELGWSSYQSHNIIYTITAEFMQYLKAVMPFDLHRAAIAKPWALELICEPQRALVQAAAAGQIDSLRLAYSRGARNYRDAIRAVTTLSLEIIAEIITFASEDLPGMSREEVLEVLLG